MLLATAQALGLQTTDDQPKEVYIPFKRTVVPTYHSQHLRTGIAAPKAIIHTYYTMQSNHSTTLQLHYRLVDPR